MQKTKQNPHNFKSKLLSLMFILLKKKNEKLFQSAYFLKNYITKSSSTSARGTQLETKGIFLSFRGDCLGVTPPSESRFMSYLLPGSQDNINFTQALSSRLCSKHYQNTFKNRRSPTKRRYPTNPQFFVCFLPKSILLDFSHSFSQIEKDLYLNVGAQIRNES